VPAILPVWQIWIGIYCLLRVTNQIIQLFLPLTATKNLQMFFTGRNGTMLTHVTPSSFSRITSLLFEEENKKRTKQHFF
jgi:hypothetical protein